MKKIIKVMLMLLIILLILFCTCNNFVNAANITVNMNTHGEETNIKVKPGDTIHLTVESDLNDVNIPNARWVSENSKVKLTDQKNWKSGIDPNFVLIIEATANVSTDFTGTAKLIAKTNSKTLAIVNLTEDIPYFENNNSFNPDNWNPGTPSQETDAKLADIGQIIVGIVQMIGSIASVIAIIIIGIRYMIGSVEEKAQYKETLLPYLFGAFLVFGITNLLKIIYELAKGM